MGPLELTANITAGHTPGCTSWSFYVQHEERKLLVVNIGSLTILPFVSLTDPETYPGIREDYRRSIETLRSLPADIFLASHTSWFKLGKKLKESRGSEDPVLPFIDPEGYQQFIDWEEEDFLRILEEQQLEKK